MAISAANLHWRESSTGPNRGSTISASTDVTVGTLFDAVTGDEASAGAIEYRGIYFTNEDSTSGGLQSAYLWISTQTPGADDVSIALAGEGLNGTMETIGSYTTAPSGESFTAPASKGAGLSMGTITATTGKYGIWIKRNVPGSCAAYNSNSFVLTVEGDSGA
jgi:hypothetical protein